jgi:hypothetical protein
MTERCFVNNRNDDEAAGLEILHDGIAAREVGRPFLDRATLG